MGEKEQHVQTMTCAWKNADKCQTADEKSSTDEGLADTGRRTGIVGGQVHVECRGRIKGHDTMDWTEE